MPVLAVVTPYTGERFVESLLAILSPLLLLISSSPPALARMKLPSGSMVPALIESLVRVSSFTQDSPSSRLT
ncbi:hypothetical protein D9M68_823910 [compost metagenome]